MKNSEKRWCFPSGPLTLPVSIQKLLTFRANHNDIDMVEKAPISYQLGGSQDYVRAEVTYFPALELCNGMVGVLSKKMRSVKATNKVVRFD